MFRHQRDYRMWHNAWPARRPLILFEPDLLTLRNLHRTPTLPDRVFACECGLRVHLGDVMRRTPEKDGVTHQANWETCC
ncbi:hypothetical protein, partial [Nocardia terpenica]|uniref:hypothetical protein n=1 Tax=Nocardia terpenica TaxID=455432 RepID=UPI002FDFF831